MERHGQRDASKQRRLNTTGRSRFRPSFCAFAAKVLHADPDSNLPAGKRKSKRNTDKRRNAAMERGLFRVKFTRSPIAGKLRERSNVGALWG
jgi:hypothetical protein